MKFKGKVAQWWYIVTVFFNAITISLFVISKMGGNSIMFVPLWIVLDLYFIPVIFCNHVTVDKKNVVVQFGLLRKTVPIQEIISIRESHNVRSSFGASFDRIEIASKQLNPVYISIVDKKGFLRELQKANRKIKYIIG